MSEGFKIVREGEEERLIVYPKSTFRMLKMLRERDDSIEESFLFGILPEDFIIGSLLNARYKFENYMPLTDLQEALRMEAGNLGRMYIADLLTKMRTSLNDTFEEPCKIIGEFTLGQIFEDENVIFEETPHMREKKVD